LGAESRVAQAWAALLALVAAPIGALATALRTTCVARETLAWAFAGIAARSTRTAGLGLRTRHAGPVVATHGHQLARGGSRGGGRGGMGFAIGLWLGLGLRVCTGSRVGGGSGRARLLPRLRFGRIGAGPCRTWV